MTLLSTFVSKAIFRRSVQATAKQVESSKDSPRKLVSIGAEVAPFRASS
jgi:hypothetical protein